MRTFLIRMNNTKPPFNNINARKAFAHAFNYMGFINDILGGYATRDPYPMPDNLWGIPKDAKGYDYDLKKAKEYARQGDRRGRADEARSSSCTCSRRTSRACRAPSSSRATWRRSASTSRSSATSGRT